jgi:hypothetical protein
MFFENINLSVVIVAAIAGMCVGYLWYAPFAFSKLWLKSTGYNIDLLRAKKEKQSMPLIYTMSTLAAIVMALVLAAVFNSLVVVGLGGIFVTGLVLWLGFIVPVKFNDYLFGGDSLTFFLISVGYQLLNILVMAFIIGIFG